MIYGWAKYFNVSISLLFHFITWVKSINLDFKANVWKSALFAKGCFLTRSYFWKDSEERFLGVLCKGSGSESTRYSQVSAGFGSPWKGVDGMVEAFWHLNCACDALLTYQSGCDVILALRGLSWEDCIWSEARHWNGERPWFNSSTKQQHGACDVESYMGMHIDAHVCVQSSLSQMLPELLSRELASSGPFAGF